jgi:DNA-binding CsgD family transcriptional regulator
MIEHAHHNGSQARIPDRVANSGKFGVRLSGREVEILRLIAQGKRTKEVANILFVSKRTIDYHLANAYLKLGVSNRIQAILLASKMGLIQTQPAADGNRVHATGLDRDLISHCPERHLLSYESVESYALHRGRTK